MSRMPRTTTTAIEDGQIHPAFVPLALPFPPALAARATFLFEEALPIGLPRLPGPPEPSDAPYSPQRGQDGRSLRATEPPRGRRRDRQGAAGRRAEGRTPGASPTAPRGAYGGWRVGARRGWCGRPARARWRAAGAAPSPLPS